MPAWVKPPLKWAGTKVRIVAQLRALLPPGKRLIEPFVGSGAVFLNTDYDEYLLADGNPDLIGVYAQLCQAGADFVAACRALFRPENNAAGAYYALRDRFNACDDPHERAILFVYLNRHGYNGLCRYNSRGEFNVPFGRYRKPYFPEKEMAHFGVHARRATFAHADFAATMAIAQPGDVVYCDPPYVPLSTTANFTSYSAERFGAAEQEQLARLAADLAERGVTVVISNHDTPFTRAIYARARLTSLQVQRSISCDGANRTRADELIAVFAGEAAR